ARLDGIRILDPKTQIVRRVLGRTRCDGATAHHVCEVWTETSSAVGAANPMTIYASSRFKDVSSRGFFLILIRRLLLCAYPGIEVFRGIHIHAQKHLRVLCPAVLRALAEKQASIAGIQPSLVWVIGNQVCLSRELRHPEAVIRVRGEQFQKCRCGM